MGKRQTTPSNEGDQTTTRRRLTVHDAAQALGISEDAVRMRVKRGTLRAEREGRRLYVLLTPDLTTDPTQTRTDELIAELRDRVRSLDAQLDQERQAHAEARRIIAGLVERIPAIEAPEGETRESPETVEAEPERGEPRPDAPGAQEGAQRPWWRRVFRT